MLTSFDRAHPLMARILRMTLVFLLVFWSSFSVQSLVAFGSEGSGSPTSGSTLTSTDDEPLEEEPDDPIGNDDEPEMTSVSIQVVWADSGDEAGDRPDSITARLYADGEETGETLDVTDSDDWLGVFEDLDATDEDGLTIYYTVSVDPVEGYDGPEIDPNGDNGYLATFVWIQDEPEEPEPISVSVQVDWDDSDNEAGDRPDSVTARLYADGEETGKTLDVTADEDWLGVFEDLDEAESGVLIDYTVSVDSVEGYEEPTVEPNGENGFLVTFVRAQGGVVESERYDSDKHEDETLVNLDIWTAESEDADAVDKKLTSASEAAAEEEVDPIALNGRDDQVVLVAVPYWEGDTYSEEEPPSMGSADFVEWEIAGNDECVDIDEDGGVLVVKGVKQGEASITLRLKEDAQGLVDPTFYENYPDKPFEAKLTVKVTMPYVSAIEIQRPDGSDYTSCLSGEELILTNEQLQSYAFRAIVRTHDQVTDENVNYEVFEGQSLSDASEGLFDDVEWRVLDKNGDPVDPEVAYISDGGVFTMVGDLQEVGHLNVECSSSQGFNGALASSTVIISSGKERIDPQGDSHPQDTLRITSNARVAAPQSPSAEPTAGDDAEEAAESGSSSSESASSDASSSASPSASGSSASASAKPVVTSEPIDKTYSLGELEALGYSTGTFNMANAEGPLTVTGEGPNLASILKDAGIEDTSAILSIDFIDYRGVKTTYSWADLTAGAARSPLVAVRSYVHEDGVAMHSVDDDDEPAENPGEPPNPAGTGNENPGGNNVDTGDEDSEPSIAQTMLENTRFRVLTDASGAIDADALRYINEINVNVDAGGGQQADDELKVRIDYTPVEYGSTALLTAIPSLEVGSARFNLSWQVSKDGENWTDLNENGSQTLYVVTDDTTIGTYYRVMMETDMLETETGKYRSAVSDPVQIKTVDEDDFYVQLAYTPPPAGELAIFTASPHLAGRTIAEYVWEYSQDGGLTWNVIPGEKSASFSVKTEPVSDEPSEEAEDSEPVVLTYVRVRAIATSGEIAVSNAQPLTVEVGGAGDDPKGDDDNSGKNSDQNKPPASDTLPTKPDSKNPDELPDPDLPTTPPESKTPIPPVDIDDPIEMPHDDASHTQQGPEGTPVPTTAPTPTTAGRAVEIQPEDLIVNPEVTALVQDQQTAIDEAVTSSRPGARWTKLETVEPTSEDIDNILADNPLAPFALPMGLGLIAAGGVEKVLAFRRQTR